MTLPTLIDCSLPNSTRLTPNACFAYQKRVRKSKKLKAKKGAGSWRDQFKGIKLVDEYFWCPETCQHWQKPLEEIGGGERRSDVTGKVPSRKPQPIKQAKRKPSTAAERQQIGRRLKEAREKADLTQAETANKLGMFRERISVHENGKVSVPIERLNAYAKLYGVSVDWLTKGEKGKALQVADQMLEKPKFYAVPADDQAQSKSVHKNQQPKAKLNDQPSGVQLPLSETTTSELIAGLLAQLEAISKEQGVPVEAKLIHALVEEIRQ